MATSEWQIAFEGAARDFAGREAIAPHDLVLGSGHLNVLLGANGAGKTTWLRMAAGLLPPSNGMVAIHGVSLRLAGTGLKQQIGYAAHDSLLYPELTARENLEFAARLSGVIAPEVRIAELAEVLGLSDLMDTRVAALSRGGRQRVSLVGALLADPWVLLLDEPFTGLDAATRSSLSQMLAERVAAGRTVVITTHEEWQSLPGPRREVELAAGRVVRDEVIAADPVHASERPGRLVGPPPPRWQAVRQIAAKELLTESRSRDAGTVAALFAVCVLLTTSFTASAAENASGAATGVLWVSLLFATLLATGRSVAREVSHRAIDRLRLAPIPADAVYLGKLLGSLALLLPLGVGMALLFALLLGGAADTVDFGLLFAAAALGVIGLVAVASLFGFIAAASRVGDALLPIMVMPVVIPLLVAAVEVSRQAFLGAEPDAWKWLGLLASFDVLVTAAAVATFGYVIEE